MKVWSFVITAFASTLALAAPTSSSSSTNSLEPRSSFDASGLNGLVFNQRDLNYLQSINSFNLNAFQQLSLNNQLNLAVFSNVFGGNVFDINALLALQTMNTLVQVANVVPFGNVNLAGVQFAPLELASLGSIGGVGLGQFVDERQLGVIQGVVSQIPAPVIL
ncbi:hypothetical protein L249_4167 [Ophiocordyceps polyrhachis-furcata BCC 54312]|uniref:Uncharacterized protein n=1 Tax=Ophiocordyceps polyrhachis-furcata BCC 54312 TaxID=1330021 RepID=A0A367L5C9_9HYPO|nr:hypothetical protein L249_4167 [Ophiocordyceps polyrhachis-furcata BCC 54312]